MEAILQFMPDEEQIKYSALTGQALFYMGQKNLKHKILAVVEEEGSERASYSLKLLQSEGELKIASTGKDPKTGKMETNEYHVEGPVMILLTTTAVEMDEELLNRCLVLSVDESRAQTQRIHQFQREQETAEGFLAVRRSKKRFALHQNAQRLLKTICVINPYARHLTFLDDKTRTRRDHKKYLALIKSITLLHQYQRKHEVLEDEGERMPYIRTTLDDIALANRLASEAFGRNLDELTPQGRQMLSLVTQMVTGKAEAQGIDPGDVRFTRRDIREFTGWSDFQVKSHMRKLEDLEYVLIHRSAPGLRTVYELLYRGEGRNGDHFVIGLLEVEKLQRNYDARWEHSIDNPEHFFNGSEHGKVGVGAPAEPPSSTRGAGVVNRVTHTCALD